MRKRNPMKLLLLAVLCLFASRFVFAAEAMEDFAYALRVANVGDNAFYRVAIPQAVYKGAAYADLRDLRVFNSDGEVVPHAFPPTVGDAGKPTDVELPFFTLRGPHGGEAADLDIALESKNGNVSLRVKSRDGQSAQTDVLGYLIDLSPRKDALSSLTLHWEAEEENYVGSVDVQASNDLKNWSTIVRDAPLVHLSQGGLMLEQKSIALHNVRWKYLRLNWRDSREIFKLLRVNGQLAGKTPLPARDRIEIAATPGKNAGEYIADTGGRFAVDRMRLHLPNDNAVAALDIYSRDDPHQEWKRVTHTVVYRLRQNGRIIESAEISFPARAHRYWLLKVDQRGGGIGTGNIGLHVGWIQREIAFAARGTGPFYIAFGNSRVASNALAMDTLVPRRAGESADEIPLIEAGPMQTLAGATAAKPRTDMKKTGLWIALLVGVAVLGFMAWRLSRQLRAKD